MIVMDTKNALQFSITCNIDDLGDNKKQVYDLQEGDNLTLIKSFDKIKISTKDGVLIGYVPDMFVDLINKSLKNDMANAVIASLESDFSSLRINIVFDFEDHEVIEKKKEDDFEEKIETKITNNEPKPEVDTTKRNFVIALIIFVVIFFMVMICIKTNSMKPNNNSGYNSDSDSVYVDAVDTSTSDAQANQNVPKGWIFNNSEDEMRNTTDVWASLESDNMVNFDFPYDGGSTLTITVRYMRKSDVLLKISSGQFIGNDITGDNYVTVKFNNGSPKRYYFNEPSDGSTDCIFINKKSNFISNLRKAKVIMIEAPFYNAGDQVFQFHVDKPLNWRR